MNTKSIKAQIYSEMAVHSLKKVGKYLEKAEKEAGKFIEEVNKAISADSKAAYAEFEKKVQKFYDSLPEDYKKEYDDMMKSLNNFESEVKKLTDSEVNAFVEMAGEDQDQDQK